MNNNIFSSSYNFGFDEACKEAGILKNTALAGLIAAGGAGGAKKGADFGSDFMAQRAYPHFSEVIREAPKVDASDFIKTHSNNIKHFTPDKSGINRLVEEFSKRKLLATGVKLEDVVDAMSKTKDVMDAANDLNLISYPSVDGILSNRKANPSLLSHEIGHIEQGRRGLDRGSSTLGIAFGNQLRNEQGAWERAHKLGLPVEPRVEQAALNPYMEAQKGALAGGTAGGAAGSAGTGGVLAMLRALISRRKE